MSMMCRKQELKKKSLAVLLSAVFAFGALFAVPMTTYANDEETDIEQTAETIEMEDEAVPEDSEEESVDDEETAPEDEEDDAAEADALDDDVDEDADDDVQTANEDAAGIQLTQYTQKDAAWKDQPLSTGETIGAIGSAFVSFTMAMSNFTDAMNPAEMNTFLKEKGLSTGWINFGLAAAQFGVTAAKIAYSGNADAVTKIVAELDKGNPVIVALQGPSYPTHVVASGYTVENGVTTITIHDPNKGIMAYHTLNDYLTKFTVTDLTAFY